MKLEELTKQGKVTLVIGTMGTVLGVYLGFNAYLKYLAENDYKEFERYGQGKIDLNKLREKGL